MIKDDWTHIKYFSEKENWGDVDRIYFELVYLLDKLRAHLDSPFVIHCAYETSGHAPKSQHYLGTAADGHFRKNINPLDVYIAAEKFRFNGIGIYPNNGNPYYHFDVRPLLNVLPKRWIFTKETGYINLTRDNLFKTLEGKK